MLNTVTRYAPFAMVLDELFGPGAAAWENREARPLALRVDVKEGPAAYTVVAEIPGVKKDDIHIEVEANEVAISAETRREAESKDEKWLRVERAYGRSERRLRLPQEIDTAKAEARFADGVVTLTLPKSAPATARRIEVH